MIGAIEAAPIVVADAAALFGGRIAGDYKAAFDRARPTRILARPECRSRRNGRSMSAALKRAVSEAARMSRFDSPSTARGADAVEPRTHLADFLRDRLDLTGTHLGCEHGVCGACTLLVDGVPARSCITYAVACDGAEVTTIEGLDDDEVTRELRAAFSPRACAAMRLLHAGHAGLGARPRAAPAEARTSRHIRVG